LDEAEALLDLHTDELVEKLVGEENYSGLYEDRLVNQYLKTEQAARNAETQFLNYEKTVKDILNGETDPGLVAEEHGVEPGLDQYIHAYRSAARIAQRQEILEKQFRALSQVMSQNNLTDIREEMITQHDWYNEPENTEGFQTAAEL